MDNTIVYATKLINISCENNNSTKTPTTDEAINPSMITSVVVVIDVNTCENISLPLETDNVDFISFVAYTMVLSIDAALIIGAYIVQNLYLKQVVV
jgi:hypothetical protein